MSLKLSKLWFLWSQDKYYEQLELSYGLVKEHVVRGVYWISRTKRCKARGPPIRAFQRESWPLTPSSFPAQLLRNGTQGTSRQHRRCHVLHYPCSFVYCALAWIWLTKIYWTISIAKSISTTVHSLFSTTEKWPCMSPLLTQCIESKHFITLICHKTYMDNFRASKAVILNNLINIKKTLKGLVKHQIFVEHFFT